MSEVLMHAHRGRSPGYLLLAGLAAAIAIGVCAAPATAGCTVTRSKHMSHSSFRDDVQFGSDSTIAAGEDVGDVVNFGGNVNVHGHVHGDAVLFGGNLHVYPEGEIDGDHVIFGGEVTDESKHHVSPTPSPATSAALVGTEAQQAVLEKVFSEDKLQADWFSPAFLAEIPLAKEQETVSGYKDRLGDYSEVNATDQGFDIVFDHGTVPTNIKLDDQGRISDLTFHAVRSSAVSVTSGAGSEITNAYDEFTSRLHWVQFIVVDAILAFLAFLLFPLRARVTLDHLSTQPLLSVVLGFFAPIILALVMLVLVVTVIGIPLVPVAAVAFLLAYLIGKSTIAAFVGKRLLEVAKVTEPKSLASVALGLLIMVVVCGVTPHWFGILIYLTIGALASGAALLGFMKVRSAAGPPPPAGYVPAPVGGYPPGGSPGGFYPGGYPPPPGPSPSGPPAVP